MKTYYLAILFFSSILLMTLFLYGTSDVSPDLSIAPPNVLETILLSSRYWRSLLIVIGVTLSFCESSSTLALPNSSRYSMIIFRLSISNIFLPTVYSIMLVCVRLCFFMFMIACHNSGCQHISLLTFSQTKKPLKSRALGHKFNFRNITYSLYEPGFHSF